MKTAILRILGIALILSPAVGSAKRHAQEQKNLIAEALK